MTPVYGLRPPAGASALIARTAAEAARRRHAAHAAARAPDHGGERHALALGERADRVGPAHFQRGAADDHALVALFGRIGEELFAGGVAEGDLASRRERAGEA